MPKRLTPAGAAAIVDCKVKAREAAAQAERAVAAQAAAEERAWQVQVKKMLAAACEGNCSLITKTRPVRVSDLRRLGFQISKEVDAENTSDFDSLLAELDGVVKMQDAAIAKMEAAVSKWVHGLIERPLKQDLQDEIIRLIRRNNYGSISGLLDADSTDLLYDVDNGEIISAALESGDFYEWFEFDRHVKSVENALTQVRKCRSAREKIAEKLQLHEKELSKIDKKLMNDAEVTATFPPFKISWPEDRNIAPWNGRPLLSASALAWIASSGQLMLQLLEGLIADAANLMRKSIVIEVRYTNRHNHILAKQNLEIVHFPPADELNQILRVVGWRPDISATPSQDYTLTLHW